jgi:hypothetical protein
LLPLSLKKKLYFIFPPSPSPDMAATAVEFNTPLCTSSTFTMTVERSVNEPFDVRMKSHFMPPFGYDVVPVDYNNVVSALNYDPVTNEYTVTLKLQLAERHPALQVADLLYQERMHWESAPDNRLKIQDGINEDVKGLLAHADLQCAANARRRQKPTPRSPAAELMQLVYRCTKKMSNITEPLLG